MKILYVYENVAWENCMKMSHEKIAWKCHMRMLHNNVPWKYCIRMLDENVKLECWMRKFAENIIWEWWMILLLQKPWNIAIFFNSDESLNCLVLEMLTHLKIKSQLTKKVDHGDRLIFMDKQTMLVVRLLFCLKMTNRTNERLLTQE